MTSYRIAEVSIPKASYAATDAEWRELPEGEFIVHVFTIASTGTVHPAYGDGVPLLLLIGRE